MLIRMLLLDYSRIIQDYFHTKSEEYGSFCYQTFRDILSFEMSKLMVVVKEDNVAIFMGYDRLT